MQLILKSRVRQHISHSKSGKLTLVREHQDKRIKKQTKKEPWEMTKEEFIASPPPGYRYRQDMPGMTVAYREEHTTVLGDKFWEDTSTLNKKQNDSGRRDLLFHEIGHDIKKPKVLMDALAPFKTGPFTYDNFAGFSQRPEEFIADLYSDLVAGHYKWREDKDSKESNAYRAVMNQAIEQKLPMPTDAKLFFGASGSSSPDITKALIGGKPTPKVAKKLAKQMKAKPVTKPVKVKRPPKPKVKKKIGVKGSIKVSKKTGKMFRQSAYTENVNRLRDELREAKYGKKFKTNWQGGQDRIAAVKKVQKDIAKLNKEKQAADKQKREAKAEALLKRKAKEQTVAIVETPEMKITDATPARGSTQFTVEEGDIVMVLTEKMLSNAEAQGGLQSTLANATMMFNKQKPFFDKMGAFFHRGLAATSGIGVYMSKDDAIMAAYEGAWQAALLYRDDKGASYKTYAYEFARGRMRAAALEMVNNISVPQKHREQVFRTIRNFRMQGMPEHELKYIEQKNMIPQTISLTSTFDEVRDPEKQVASNAGDEMNVVRPRFPQLAQLLKDEIITRNIAKLREVLIPEEIVTLKQIIYGYEPIEIGHTMRAMMGAKTVEDRKKLFEEHSLPPEVFGEVMQITTEAEPPKLLEIINKLKIQGGKKVVKERRKKIKQYFTAYVTRGDKSVEQVAAELNTKRQNVEYWVGQAEKQGLLAEPAKQAYDAAIGIADVEGGKESASSRLTRIMSMLLKNPKPENAGKKLIADVLDRVKGRGA